MAPSLTSRLRTLVRGRQVQAAVQRLPASARNMKGDGRYKRPSWSAWQTRANDLAEQPEPAEAITWIGNACSKVRLYCAYQANPDADPVPLFEAADPPEGDPIPGVTELLAETAQSTLDMVKGPLGGRAQIQKQMAANLCTSGDGYLWASQDSNEWRNLSIEQVRNIAGSFGEYQINLAPIAQAGTWFDLPPGDILYRYWNPHWRYGDFADSAMRHILDQLEERCRIDDTYKAVEQSRLANAGYIVFDSRARFPDEGDYTQNPAGDPASNDTLSRFAEAGMTAITQPGAASAALPVLLEIDMGDSPDRRIQDYIYHGVLERNMSDQDAQRWATLTTQIIQGLPCPPEIITGLGDSSTYANAKLVTHEAYSAYLQPVVGTICDTFTRGWLQPALASLNQWPPDLIDKVVVAADPDTIISQPDRAKYAIDLLAAGEINGKAARSALGFDEGDAPDDDVAQTSKVQAVGVPSLLEAQVMTINEARTASGLLPIEGGDRFLTAEEIAARRTTGQQGQLPQAPAQADDVEESPNEVLPASIEAVVVAAANPQAVARLGDRLAAVDAELDAWVAASVEAAMEGAVNRAGARLKQAAQGTGMAKHLKQTPLGDVYATLGKDRAVQLASTSTLLEGAFAELEAPYRQRVANAQQRARTLAAQTDEAAFDADVLAEMEAEQDAARDESWLWLSAALVGLAERRLEKADDTPSRGEASVTSTVPYGYVRGAMEIAGGVDPDDVGDPDGFTAREDSDPPGETATGRIIRGALATYAAVQVLEYVWVWGGADRPFEPHVELDGVTFQQWDDPALANSEDFPPTPSYMPGDHIGCSCQAIPQFVQMDSEPEGLT